MSTEIHNYPPSVLVEAESAMANALKDAGGHPFMHGALAGAQAYADVLARYTVAKRAEVKAPPLRVFRYAGDAYQVDAVADYADMAGGIYVRLSDGVAAFDSSGVVMIPARLSTWHDWYNVTLISAAHDYLDACIAFPLGGDSRQHVDTDHALEAVIACAREGRIWFTSAEWHAGYLLRVVDDLRARLRGEKGRIPTFDGLESSDPDDVSHVSVEDVR